MIQSSDSKTLPLVATVILNFNGQKYLEQFLPSVLATNYAPHQIIIADNGSTDDSISFLQKEYDQLTLLDLKENHGFAGGYNEALKQVEASYYVLLNSDVEVDANWLTPIIELMEQDKTIAACQPKILAYHNKTTFEHAGAAGGYMDALGYPLCRGRIMDNCEEDKGQHDSVEEIFWATGAAMVIRKELYHAIGGLDADYFAHMEEIDLCWRLKLAGYKIMVHPAGVVYHVGGGTLSYSSPRKTYLNFRNSLATIFKNESFGKLCWLLPTRLILDGMAGVLFLSKGQFQHIWQIIRAHFSFYGRVTSLVKKRKKNQALIKQISIDTRNNRGQLPISVVWKYFLKGKKTFSALIKKG